MQLVGVHPGGQEIAVDLSWAAGALAAAFFFLSLLTFCFGAGCAAGVDVALDAGAGAGVASAAHAGTTIKANNNRNIFFMVFTPVKDIKIVVWQCASHPKQQLLLHLCQTR
ncbi:MAG: hypothetical protein PHQ60_09550 [Sideroxydans sp.]|nr:hypothetical protein [Sideroxydans sp.]